jgi:cyclopropane-fatty-acyl-phospholipid synthase
MANTSTAAGDPGVSAGRSFLEDLLADYHPRDFAVRFWDDSVWEPEAGQKPRFTLVLRHPGSLRRMFWPPGRLTVTEAYIFEDYDVEGEMEPWLAVMHHLGHRAKTMRWLEKLRRGLRLFRMPAGERRPTRIKPVEVPGELHSKERDRQAVTYHYNVSNDFYALWLDSRMVYSCGYFLTPEDGIDAAQEQKLDYVCRKLRLRPGEKLLDFGCGWGALTLHAAKNYGVHVLGVTISQPQVDLGNERIRAAGLADRARLECLDYRDVREPGGFDKVAAIGIMEHVGEKMFPTYFQTAWNLCKPGGVFLTHGIALRGSDAIPRGPNFANRYVWPDGELLPLHRYLTYAEKAGWEVRDVESLRDHYVLTLRHWVPRLESRAEEARRCTDELRYRIYRLILSLSAYGFSLGRINLYQTLLYKPERGPTRLPLTREDWYAS